MNLPEKETDDKFCQLAEDFNKSATNFAGGNGLSLDGLMTKFNILWKFKADCPEDHVRLTQSMFECGMTMLRRVSDANNRENINNVTQNVTQVMNFVTTPEQMQFLPPEASDRLVDAALDLVRKSEGITYVYGWNDYQQHKDGLINLAKTIVTYAEKTREPKPAVATFATGKTIPPAKRLTLSNDN